MSKIEGNMLIVGAQALKVAESEKKFINGFKVEAVETFCLDDKWGWQIWTSGFYFGGKCLYNTKEEAEENALVALKYWRDNEK